MMFHIKLEIARSTQDLFFEEFPTWSEVRKHIRKEFEFFFWRIGNEVKTQKIYVHGVGKLTLTVNQIQPIKPDPLGPLQRKWVEALKGNKYSEGAGYYLRDDKGYSALGVAARILGQHGHKRNGIWFFNGCHITLSNYQGIGLKNPFGWTEGLNIHELGIKIPFKELGQLIEDNAHDLFEVKK